MKTSKQWWNELLSDHDKMIGWLKKQYHGERMAGDRIREVFDKFDLTDADREAVTQVAGEEDLHASWIAGLLKDRGISAEVLDHEERYWQHAFQDLETPEDAAAVGYLAEKMRLDRILAIANCQQSPYDIMKVMKRIYVQELGHVKVFQRMSNKEAIDAHLDSHLEGMNALGLVS